jgi:peroxiredoxin
MYSFLKKNDPAPDFTASTYEDKTVALEELRRKGPVLLSFLRGFS